MEREIFDNQVWWHAPPYNLLGTKFNEAVTKDIDVFATYLTPSAKVSIVRIQCTISVATTFAIVIKRGATSKVIKYKDGANFPADCGQSYDYIVRQGDTINFQAGADCTIQDLKVVEIPAGV